MPYVSRTLKYAVYEQDAGQVHETEDRRTGTVTVHYSGARSQEFEKINRGDFFLWERAGFKWNDSVPAGVRTLPPDVHYTRQEQTEGTDDEPDASEDESEARRQRRFKLASDALKAGQTDGSKREIVNAREMFLHFERLRVSRST